MYSTTRDKFYETANKAEHAGAQSSSGTDEEKKGGSSKRKAGVNKNSHMKIPQGVPYIRKPGKK